MLGQSEQQKLDRLNRTIEAQKAFLHRVPDPDTRERAEANLHCLVDMRDDVARICEFSPRPAHSV